VPKALCRAGLSAAAETYFLILVLVIRHSRPRWWWWWWWWWYCYKGSVMRSTSLSAADWSHTSTDSYWRYHRYHRHWPYVYVDSFNDTRYSSPFLDTGEVLSDKEPNVTSLGRIAFKHCIGAACCYRYRT